MTPVIVSCGARTPVGTTAPMTLAAWRINLSRLTAHRHYIDSQENPLVLGTTESIPELTPDEDRISLLAIPAIQESLEMLENNSTFSGSIHLIVGIPSDIEWGGDFPLAPLHDAILKHCAKYAFNTTIQFVPKGHASFYLGVAEARKKLDKTPTDLFLIGGVDSYHNKTRLQKLIQSGRLKCQDESFGMIPGEGAAFCLVGEESAVRSLQLPIMAKITAVSTGLEPRSAEKGDILTGEGLTAVWRDVLSLLTPEVQIDQIFCDLNGERERAQEYGFTAVRLKKYFRSISDFNTLTDACGDMGAASGAISCISAIQSNPIGADSRLHFCYGASYTGERGAMSLKIDKT